MRRFFNWKVVLSLAAILIVGATLYFTNKLSVRLAFEERKNIQHVSEGLRVMANSQQENQELFSYILGYIDSNTSVPMIMTDNSGHIISYKNIDTTKVLQPDAFFARKVKEFKEEHQPIIVNFDGGKNIIYYGESYLLRQLRIFPFIQIGVIVLFLTIVFFAITSAHKSMQNQVWVGLSKETAHQLGTPLSSITGWLEILKDNEENNMAVTEMEKDLSRLQLVADRFSKIGSTPRLEEENIIIRLQQMVEYMQKRSPGKVQIALGSAPQEVLANISGPLFDWVIENLIRNALDAMDGKGQINIAVIDKAQEVLIDVSDTGKGIPPGHIKKVFSTGFTTKKRGWGLGLSLSRRIIQNYHFGSLFVKQSEVGKGTTFRIILRR